ncbi:metallophosphoesterase [Methylopila musalis]|uniref:Metallophosphoesterase n=1 Tax=Methylopila musalis TaxID=1134781 RepID=A0ABW3Z409_9HYPH
MTSSSRPASRTFALWVFSDAHVATDKAVSAAIRHGMSFTPPAGYPESLATALRQSEEGGDLGGPPFHWEIALDLGDNAGHWDLPDDEQGVEVVRQYGALRAHRREQIYPIAGNHDASAGSAASSQGKPANWWFRKYVDPLGEFPETSGVHASRRPYPVTGEWDRYAFQVGNIRFLMMSDRNDLPYPVGRQDFGGGSPAGAVTGETWEWWRDEVEAAGRRGDVVVSCHHHMLRETTVGSGDYEGVSRYPDGRYRHGLYHGVDGVPEGASYLYFVDDEPKAQRFERYLEANPGAVDLWLGGHTHTYPDDVVSGRSHVERRWGTNFVNCAQLSKYHSFVTCPPMSRHFTFTNGSPLVRVRCYLHDDSHAAQGWYPPAERVLELNRPFQIEAE